MEERYPCRAKPARNPQGRPVLPLHGRPPRASAGKRRRLRGDFLASTADSVKVGHYQRGSHPIAAITFQSPPTKRLARAPQSSPESDLEKGAGGPVGFASKYVSF